MKTIAIIPVYGESDTIGSVLQRFDPGYVDEICVVADPAVHRVGIRIPIEQVIAGIAIDRVR